MSTERPGRPHAESASARFITRRIDELRGVKIQREIATEVGFKKPNVLSMIKTGEIMLPLERIPALARALQSDPAHLFRLTMQDHWPELRAVMDEIFGRQMATANENAVFLTKWRIATDDSDPAPNAKINVAVDSMLKTLI